MGGPKSVPCPQRVQDLGIRRLSRRQQANRYNVRECKHQSSRASFAAARKEVLKGIETIVRFLLNTDIVAG